MAVASPGLNIMQATMVPNNSMIAYIILLDDEFLHDGHALQQRPQAALPQQQANWAALQIPNTAPILFFHLY